MARDTGGNIAVDFVWGNIPMQPDDDRSTPLDPNLDSHIIATSQYNGFPGNTPVFPYLDVTGNIAIPNVVGLTESVLHPECSTCESLVKNAFCAILRIESLPPGGLFVSFRKPMNET